MLAEQTLWHYGYLKEGDRREDKENLIAEQVSAIERICLDPSAPFEEDFGERDVNEMKRFRSAHILKTAPIVETSVSKAVWAALEYARARRCLVIIDGEPGLGKSTAARAWCERSGGLARFLEVPSSNDDVTFFRRIAQALGVSASIQIKAVELRAKIESTLQSTRDLMLVMDESQWVWPVKWQRYAMPSRVNWILTALANHSVPVALVSSPLFIDGMYQVQEQTYWNAKQLIRRIGHMEELPKNLEFHHYAAIAKSMLPHCSKGVILGIAECAERSHAKLGCLKAIKERSTWIAEQAGRQEPSTEDVRSALGQRMVTEKRFSSGPADRKRKAAPAPAPQISRDNGAPGRRGNISSVVVNRMEPGLVSA